VNRGNTLFLNSPLLPNTRSEREKKGEEGEGGIESTINASAFGLCSNPGRTDFKFGGGNFEKEKKKGEEGRGERFPASIITHPFFT